MDKGVFFDRDGVLNVEKGYLYKIEDFQWQPQAVEAIRWLKEQGYFIAVVTNQSGVARGYYTEQDVWRLHGHMQQELQRAGGKIDAFYYCPHLPESLLPRYAGECNCRKPASGMLERALLEHGIDAKNSFLVGDSQRDLAAGKAVGVASYLYSGGCLLEFVKEIVEQRSSA